MTISPLARAVLALAAAHSCACAQDPFTVAVFSYADAPHSAIADAVATARNAFTSAGVASRWVVCVHPNCAAELPANGWRLEVFIMPRLRSPVTGHAAGHPAGYAMPGGFAHPRAYAFYDAARIAADTTGHPVDVVLGCILVHEIGHLLGLHHQPYGVMRARLEVVDIDNTAIGRAFNSDERRQLRAAVGAKRESAQGAKKIAPTVVGFLPGGSLY